MGTPLDPSVNHRITRAEAAAAARRHREWGPEGHGESGTPGHSESGTPGRVESGTPGRRNCGAFNAKAVLELLSQPGCVGLRYYHARTAQGKPSMVLVGVDEKGNNMTSGTLLNLDMDCPPYCPDPDDLDE